MPNLMPDQSKHSKRRTLAASLMLMAGLVHLALAAPHLQDARGAGLFFLSLAGGQIVWAVMMLHHRTKRLERIGTIGLALAPTILYAITRMVRAPYGVAPEPVDTMGLVAVLLQIGVIGSLWSTAPRRHANEAHRHVAAGLAIALIAYGGAIASEGIDALAEPEGPHGHEENGPQDHVDAPVKDEAAGSGPEPNNGHGH